ncbi:MAG: hypothetical protein LCH30_02415 [Proteobacteria bacterium]|nr:hypothetical protein [Pseudomonadota bacterium]
MNNLIKITSLILCLYLSACKELPPSDYDVAEVGKLKKVAAGVIISKRAVTFRNKEAQSTSAAPGSDFIDGGKGFVYVIKLNSGKIISVAQAEDLKLKVKQHILVVYGKHTRVLPDDGSNG